MPQIDHYLFLLNIYINLNRIFVLFFEVNRINRYKGFYLHHFSWNYSRYHFWFFFMSKKGVEEMKLQLVNPANKNYTIMVIAQI